MQRTQRLILLLILLLAAILAVTGVGRLWSSPYGRYCRIQNGMSYARVKSILGCEPTFRVKQEHVEMGPFNELDVFYGPMFPATYIWKLSDGSLVCITFSPDGTVNEKQGSEGLDRMSSKAPMPAP